MRCRLCLRFIGLLICGVLLLNGCDRGTTGSGSTATTAPSGGEKVKIGFLVKQPDEPWFQTEWAFAQKAADENRFELLKMPSCSLYLATVRRAMSMF